MSLADIQSMKALKLAKQNATSLIDLSSLMTNYKVSLKASGSNTYAYGSFAFDTSGMTLTSGAVIKALATINTAETGLNVAVKCFQADTLAWGDSGNSDLIENGLQSLTANTILNVSLTKGRDNTKRYVKLYFMIKNIDTTAFKILNFGGVKCIIDGKSLPLVAYGVYTSSGDSSNLSTPISTGASSNNSKWANLKGGILGDSITYGQELINGSWVSVTTPFHQTIKNKLGMASMINYGVSSTSISTKSDYADNTNAFINRYSSMASDLDLIVVFGGTNDFGHNTPIGTIADTTDISFYGALNVIMDGLSNKYPGKRIVFMTPLHRNRNGTEGETNSIGVTLKQYVQAIRDVAEKFSIPIIDTYSRSGLTPFVSAINTAYFSDGLHPNSAGHDLLATNIVKQFEAI